MSDFIARKIESWLHTFVGVRELCQLETFSASCGQDEVIVMQYARYGRMRLGRCVKVCIVMQYARYGRMRLGRCVKVCIVMQYARYGRMRLGRCVKVCNT